MGAIDDLIDAMALVRRDLPPHLGTELQGRRVGFPAVGFEIVVPPCRTAGTAGCGFFVCAATGSVTRIPAPDQHHRRPGPDVPRMTREVQPAA